MDKPGYDDFEAGDADWYTITTDKPLGYVNKVKVRHTTGPLGDQWKRELMYVEQPGDDAYHYFPCGCWFATQTRILNEQVANQ